MSSLAVLLQPLSEADFAHLVAAWLAGDVGGAPARALALLAAQTGDRQVTEAVLENVYAKLTAAGMLPDRSAAKNLLVPCCSTACALCSCKLEAAEAKSAYALCWDTGLQRVRYESRRCVTCGCSYSSCWRLGQAGTVYLCSTPLHLQFLQILAHPQADSCAFVECRLLTFCASLVVRLRASFIGILQVLQDTMAAGLPLVLRQELFQAWMFWRSLAVLPAGDLADIPFVFSHNCRDHIHVWLERLQGLLQDRHLRFLGREHSCSVCARCPPVGVDGKMAVSAAVCACLSGPEWTCHYTGLRRMPGCWLPPCRRSRFCRLHAGAGPDFNDLLCPAEHALVLLPDSGQRHHFCDVCAATVPLDSALWRCEACDFDVCADCACCNTDQGPPAVHPADLHSGPPSAEAEDEDDPDANPCGIVKRLPGTRLRRQGGVLTAMLACGRVAHVQLLAGAESPTQVTILLAQLRAVRPFSYVVYDDACHLARFVRNRARRSGRLALGDLASAKFVIDRFHRANHTACLDEGSRHYLAEVKIEEHPVLAGLALLVLKRVQHSIL